MPAREPRRRSYRWHKINPVYGPWYRLTADGKPISGAEVMVMPDMNNERWFWYVRIGSQKAPRERFDGHEPTLDEARETARAVFDREY